MRSMILLLTLSGLSITFAYSRDTFGVGNQASWINREIVAYYAAGHGVNCDIKDFDSRKFVPLSISFKGNGDAVMAFRIEQTLGHYKAKFSRNGFGALS